MTENNTFPKAKIVSGDPINGIFKYQNSLGSLFTVIIREEEQKGLCVYKNNEEIGVIIRGSNWSGSIWINGGCFGEYERVNEKYMIIPYIGGRKAPEKTLQNTHPLDYLIEKLS
jgi:hypothetical protein